MPKKILVIEDESDILTFLMTLLEDHGFQAFTIRADDALVHSIRSEKPDLVVLDVMMPLRSGVSVYRELRACSDLDGVPVVILSGFAPNGGSMSSGFRKMVQDATIRPPDGFIDKPVDVNAFISLVHQLIRSNED